MKERQTKKNEKIDRGVINDSDDLFSGGCGGKNQSSAGTDTSAVGETAENADSSASSEDVVAYQAGTWMVLLIQIQVLVCA